MLADKVTSFVGSWKFITAQSGIIAFWICYNLVSKNPWDSYPFVFLNLGLSFQAAYTAPIIMMSQNRQAELDRIEAKKDSETNTKAELEIQILEKHIELLEQKISHLVEKNKQKSTKEPL